MAEEHLFMSHLVHAGVDRDSQWLVADSAVRRVRGESGSATEQQDDDRRERRLHRRIIVTRTGLSTRRGHATD